MTDNAELVILSQA